MWQIISASTIPRSPIRIFFVRTGYLRSWSLIAIHEKILYEKSFSREKLNQNHVIEDVSGKNMAAMDQFCADLIKICLKKANTKVLFHIKDGNTRKYIIWNTWFWNRFRILAIHNIRFLKVWTDKIFSIGLKLYH